MNLQKFNLKFNTQNHPILFVVCHVKEDKPKNMLKVKAVVGIVLIVHNTK